MSSELQELKRQLREKEDKIRELESHNKRLNDELRDKDRELDDKRKEIRELKLSGGAPRKYIDPEDEKEANAWREKANNLLTLLDNLQSDMQKDLKDLESETFSPGSSRLSAGRTAAYEPSPSYARESTRESRVERRSPDPTPIRTEGERSGQRHSEKSRERGHGGHRHRHERDEDDEEAAPAPAPAAGGSASGGGATGLQNAYKALGASAKKIHNVYKNIKDAVGRSPDQEALWKNSHHAIKEAAKAARKASQEAAKATFDGEFKESAQDLARKESEWVTSAHSLARSLKSKPMKGEAEQLGQFSRTYDETATALAASPSSSSAIDAHARATKDLADVMDKLMTTVAVAFGVDANSQK